MKIIRKSIIRKAFIVFLCIVAINAGGVYVLETYFKDQSFQIYLLLVISNSTIIIIFGYFFLTHIHFPLRKIHKEVNALLTGKPYHRIVPSSIDELGVLTHFFNEITRNLEQISFDIKDRKRMASELDIASQIQKDVLPKEAPIIAGLEVVAKTRSAAEVGGDSFDFLQNDENTFIYIGDVTGHGVPSGLVMMMVNTLVHVFSKLKRTANEVVIETNKYLTPRISSNLFMTLVMLRWNAMEQKLYYAGAGHEHILVYRAKSREVEAIPSGGIALGMIPDVSKIAVEKEIPLEIDDVIVLYTDGITEAKNHKDEMYEVERLKASLKRHGYRSNAESIFDKISEDFADFVEEYVQNDDITFMCFKYKGKEAEEKKVKLMLNVDEHKLKTEGRWSW